jgi:hypothetical protein
MIISLAAEAILFPDSVSTNFSSFATNGNISVLSKREESFLRIQNGPKGFQSKVLEGFLLWFASFS